MVNRNRAARERLLYQSSNGDAWQLTRGPASKLPGHEPNRGALPPSASVVAACQITMEAAFLVETLEDAFDRSSSAYKFKARNAFFKD